MDGSVSKLKSKGAVVTAPAWEERGGVGQNGGRGRSLGTFSRAFCQTVRTDAAQSEAPGRARGFSAMRSRGPVTTTAALGHVRLSQGHLGMSGLQAGRTLCQKWSESGGQELRQAKMAVLWFTVAG